MAQCGGLSVGLAGLRSEIEKKSEVLLVKWLH